MKRALTAIALLAMGFLMASSDAAAQDRPASAGGEVTLELLGRTDVSSSKFEEYREVPKGLSLPFLNLFATRSSFDFNLVASNVRQSNQRYVGWFNTGYFDLGFDYNQTPHNMGNDAHLIWTETAPGVWSMNSTLRTYLASQTDPKSSSARNYAFYTDLLSPILEDANLINVSSLRQRGTMDLDLSQKLPFDFAFSYMREVKSGYRGQGGGDILGWVTTVADVPEPLNEVVQDFGFRAAYKLTAGSVLKAGTIHGAFNRNVFNNRSETLQIDNPFRPNDVAYTSSSAVNGGAVGFFTTAPDNEASTGSLGLQLKFARQTRVAFDWAAASWTQNAAFYPYTMNTTIFTDAGQPANLASSLPQSSLNGKIATRTINFHASTRPIDGLGIRLQYRSYGYKDKSARYVITADTSASPDVRWRAANTPTAEEPYGHATANRTDADTSTFNLQGSYDIKDLTLEGVYKNIDTSWVGRVNSSGSDGKEKVYALAAVYHAIDLVNVRFMVDWSNRTVSGFSPTSTAATQGVMEDHAKRDQNRVGFNVEFTPMDPIDLTFTYYRRNVEYPDRPAEAASDPASLSGLLSAKYDSFTGEVAYHPNAKVELDFYYTYEKDARTNQWVSLSSGNVNNKLNFAGNDKTNTFGLNAAFQLVPDKWTLRVLARQQKIDGFMDITAREGGSFYTPGRTTLIPAGQGGAADIDDWDDTTLTTVGLQLDYAIARAWKVVGGYAYEKYEYGNAYTSGTTMFPQSVLIFMKADNGAYKANVAYTKLTYRF